MTKRHDDIVEALRRRVQAGIDGGTLAPGDRLPSTRELAQTFDVDPRSVLAAYQVLVREGIIEARMRSGFFVADRQGATGATIPPIPWLAEILAQSVGRGVAAPALAGWLRRAMRHPLRAAAIATTLDQLYGLCRELADDFGFRATSVPADRALRRGGSVPRAIREADVLVTTEVHSSAVRKLATRLGKECVVIRLRDDLVEREWRELLERPVYVVLEDPRFADMMREFFGAARKDANVRPIVVGRDDIGAIPADASVYVTQAARRRLGDAHVPGTLIPPARFFSHETAREILEILVRRNLVGMRD